MNEMMSLYIDNLLNDEERKAFEAHIHNCPECKEELNLLQSMVGDFNDFVEVELPVGFHEELMDKINTIELEDIDENMDQHKTLAEKLRGLFRRTYMVPVISAICLLLVVLSVDFDFIMNKSSHNETADSVEMETAQTQVSKNADYESNQMTLTSKEEMANVADEGNSNDLDARNFATHFDDKVDKTLKEDVSVNKTADTMMMEEESTIAINYENIYSVLVSAIMKDESNNTKTIVVEMENIDKTPGLTEELVDDLLNQDGNKTDMIIVTDKKSLDNDNYIILSFETIEVDAGTVHATINIYDHNHVQLRQHIYKLIESEEGLYEIGTP